MQHINGKVLAAFSVHVTIVNEGKRPLEIRDLLLVADTNYGQILYEPIFLWDLRQWVEDGNRPDRVGRTQKGQVPLPIQLNAGQFYDFGYSIFFLPLDKETMVEPARHSATYLRLYAFTDRNNDYVEISEQVMEKDDLKPLLSQGFSGVVSTASKARRQKFFEELQKATGKNITASLP